MGLNQTIFFSRARAQMVFLLCWLVAGCASEPKLSEEVSAMEPPPKIPTVEFDYGETFFNRRISRWQLKADSTMVSGYVATYYGGGRLLRKFGVLNGKKEGEQITYFPTGEVKFIESFRDNRLSGKVRRWTMENGYQLVADLHYRNGKLHGEQKNWYNTGELHKHLQMDMGREEGLQKAFRKNGALYANYEARNGRVFGLKRANLCYELRDEEVVFIQ